MNELINETYIGSRIEIMRNDIIKKKRLVKLFGEWHEECAIAFPTRAAEHKNKNIKSLNKKIQKLKKMEKKYPEYFI